MKKILLSTSVVALFVFAVAVLPVLDCYGQLNGNFKTVRYVNAPPEDDILPVNGTIYYNEDSLKFRVYEGGVWKDLVSEPGLTIPAENGQVIFQDANGVIRGTSLATIDTVNNRISIGNGNILTAPFASVVIGNGNSDGGFPFAFVLGNGITATSSGTFLGTTTITDDLTISDRLITNGNADFNGDVFLNQGNNLAFADDGNVFLRNNGSGNFVFTDNSISAAGIRYNADYSANYVNRSLVDKEYVDNAIPVVPTNYWATDGTSTMTANTVINDGGFDISFTAPNNGILYSADYGANYVDRSLIDFGNANQFYWKTSGTSTMTANTVINDGGFDISFTAPNNGILYSADYGANYVDRSLIDFGNANQFYWKTSGTSLIVGNTEISNPSHLSTTIANTSGTNPTNIGLTITSGARLGAPNAAEVFIRSDSVVHLVAKSGGAQTGREIRVIHQGSSGDNADWNGILYYYGFVGGSQGNMLLQNIQNRSEILAPAYMIGPKTIRRDTLWIDEWNMDILDVLPTLTAADLGDFGGVVAGKDILSVDVMIINDDGDIFRPLNSVSVTGTINGGVVAIDASGGVNDGSITIMRVTGGDFDNANYDNPDVNRGYALVTYFEPASP